MNKISKNIPLSRPSFYKEEATEVRNVLESGWLTQGSKVEQLEKEFSEYCKCKYGAVCNSGASALYLALAAHNVGRGDEVIVPTITFVATPNSVVLRGAKPVFCEVSERTGLIDLEDVKRKVTKKTKAIMPVHLYGCPVNMDKLNELAKDKGLVIIEDAAHAHGAEFMGKRIGSFGNTTCFSFHPMKNMTCGEGGIILSDDEKIIDTIKVLRSNGEATPAWQRFNNQEIKKRVFVKATFNLRMSDIHASIGLVQLKHLDENNEKRILIAKKYQNELAQNGGITIPKTYHKDRKHIFHMYTPLFKNKGIRNNVQEHLTKNNIGCGIYYNPCHLEPVYRESLNYKEGSLPISEDMSGRILSIPMYPGLINEEIKIVCEKINEVVS